MLNETELEHLSDLLSQYDVFWYNNGKLSTAVDTVTGSDVDIFISKDNFLQFIELNFVNISHIKLVSYSNSQFLVHLNYLNIYLHFHIGLSFIGSQKLKFESIKLSLSENKNKCENEINNLYMSYRYKKNLFRNQYPKIYWKLYENRYLRQVLPVLKSTCKTKYLFNKIGISKATIICHGVDGSGKSTLIENLSRLIIPMNNRYFGLRSLLVSRIWKNIKQGKPVRMNKKMTVDSHNVLRRIYSEIKCSIILIEYWIKFITLKYATNIKYLILDRSPLDLVLSKFKECYSTKLAFYIIPSRSLHLVLIGNSVALSRRSNEYSSKQTHDNQKLLLHTFHGSNVRYAVLDANATSQEVCSEAVLVILEWLLDCD